MATRKQKIKEHLAHFSIAGFTYYDGPEAFSKLKIGTALQLTLDPENAYDARAVKICFKEFHLGYVPRAENRIFYKLLKVGFTQFSVKIQRIDSAEHPENQVDVVVHLIG